MAEEVPAEADSINYDSLRNCFFVKQHEFGLLTGRILLAGNDHLVIQDASDMAIRVVAWAALIDAELFSDSKNRTANSGNCTAPN